MLAVWGKEAFGLVPGGTIVKDRNGETMLVFYDILAGEIRHKIGDEGLKTKEG